MNRFLSIIAFLVLVGFVGILLLKVPRLDLAAMILLTVGMVGYDFFVYKDRSGDH
ncbi:hypothetical protein [Rhizobium arsenicireducens]|jgi:hypothetical protein